MDRPTFTAMYGRRRLGKYSLITRVITDNDVYYLADESESSAQRILLSKVVAQKFDGFDKVTYPDWETLFRSINYRTEDIDQDDTVNMSERMVADCNEWGCRHGIQHFRIQCFIIYIEISEDCSTNSCFVNIGNFRSDFKMRIKHGN